MGQPQPFRVFKIERDAALRIVKEREAPGSVKSDFAIFEWRILKPKAIGTLSRFNVNHPRAKVRQVLADARSGGIRAEFDDLDIGKGIFALRSSGRGCRANERRFCGLPKFVF